MPTNRLLISGVFVVATTILAAFVFRVLGLETGAQAANVLGGIQILASVAWLSTAKIRRPSEGSVNQDPVARLGQGPTPKHHDRPKEADDPKSVAVAVGVVPIVVRGESEAEDRSEASEDTEHAAPVEELVDPAADDLRDAGGPATVTVPDDFGDAGGPATLTVPDDFGDAGGPATLTVPDDFGKPGELAPGDTGDPDGSMTDTYDATEFEGHGADEHGSMDDIVDSY